MIIELYGLPAVGKTTYARQCAGATHVHLESRRETFRWFCAFVAKYPLRACLQAYTILRNSPNVRLFVMKCINMLVIRNARMMKARSIGEPCILLDEGPFQSMLSVFEVPLTQERAKKYLHSLILPDALIILEISEDERMERRARRKKGLRDSLGEEYTKSWNKVLIHNDSVIRSILDDISMKHVVVPSSVTSTPDYFNTTLDPCAHF